MLWRPRWLGRTSGSSVERETRLRPSIRTNVARQSKRCEGPSFPTARCRPGSGWTGGASSRVLVFAIPIALVCLSPLGTTTHVSAIRFEFGYRFLAIAWRGRVEKWGLFDYHYLARNLGVVFTSLPFVSPREVPRFQINPHGLALWFTTPAYFWLLWPRQDRAATSRALADGRGGVGSDLFLPEHRVVAVRLPLLERLRGFSVCAARNRRVSLSSTVLGGGHLGGRRSTRSVPRLSGGLNFSATTTRT